MITIYTWVLKRNGQANGQISGFFSVIRNMQLGDY